MSANELKGKKTGCRDFCEGKDYYFENGLMVLTARLLLGPRGFFKPPQ
jgi:hypothetical protein